MSNTKTIGRRSLLGAIAGAMALLPEERAEQVAKDAPIRPRDAIRITKLETFLVKPRWLFLKIHTNVKEIVGLGEPITEGRALTCATAVKEIEPYLVGKDPRAVVHHWQAIYRHAFYRGGPILTSALSGIDMALWDIKGKVADLPVYELLGGRARKHLLTYSNASGRNFDEVEENARKMMARGYKVIKVQVAAPGAESGYAVPQSERVRRASEKAWEEGLPPAEVWEPGPYVRTVPKLFEHLRKKLGEDIELLHDVHERVSPREAVQFAKDVEPVKLFYLEDALSPEDIAYFRQIRAQCNTPLAMGELFNSPHEWTPLIVERLIDYIRCHVSQVGGVTPARKIAALSSRGVCLSVSSVARRPKTCPLNSTTLKNALRRLQV